MQAYFEPEQACSISMSHPVFEILIAYKKKTCMLAWVLHSCRLFFVVEKTKHNHSSSSDWWENSKSSFKKMVELFLKIQENIRISILKRRLLNLYKKENFKPEIKPIIENLQDEL